MILGLVAIVIAAVVVSFALVFAIERKRCPACQRRAVAMKFTDGYTDDQVDIVSYRCRRCGAEFRACNNSTLIPREAFDAGARDPLPKATAQERT